MSLTLSGRAFQAKQASDPAATSKNPVYSLLRPVGVGCIEAAAFGAVLAQVGNLVGRWWLRVQGELGRHTG